MALNVFVQVWIEIDPTLNVRIDRATGEVSADEGDVLRRVSPLGRAAVAAAAGISNAVVTAFSVGGQHIDALRSAVAAGAVQAIELLAAAELDSTGTDAALSAWLRQKQPDLVIADSRAGLLAGRLGWSHLSGIESLEVANGQLCAVRQLGRGEREAVVSRLPAVIRWQTESIRPPYISRARIRSVPPDSIRCETLGPVGASATVEAGPLQPARLRTRGGRQVSKPASRGIDRLAALMSETGPTSTAGSNVRAPANATPEELADELVRYLLHHDLLPH